MQSEKPKRKPARREFSVLYSTKSTHWINVILHRTRKGMRYVLRRRGHDSSQTEAACWQCNKPAKDGNICDLHFCPEHMTVGHIVHECSHAAYHRTVLLGLPLTDDRFQEWVADDTGRLSDALIALLDKEGVKVWYDVVPKRRAI